MSNVECMRSYVWGGNKLYWMPFTLGEAVERSEGKEGKSSSALDAFFMIPFSITVSSPHG